MMRRQRNRFRFLEERELFDEWLQVIDPKRHTLQPNPTPETMNKQSHEQGLEVGFPTGAAWEQLACDMFEMIAISDGKDHPPTDPPLLPQRRTEMLQQFVQSAP
jgi:hypothetical protein